MREGSVDTKPPKGRLVIIKINVATADMTYLDSPVKG